MRTYPLKIEAVHTDDERIYMSKGHHDPHAFMTAVREYGESMPLSTPTYHQVKQIPDRSEKGACSFHFVEAGCRGAFPATYTHQYGADVYPDKQVVPFDPVAVAKGEKS